MGEEEKKKKQPEGEKKAEGGKTVVAEKKEKEENPDARSPAADPAAENPKEETGKKSEYKDAKAEEPQPPPEIVLRVYMHCEGCAQKVRRCLKGFDGVEEVITDCKTHKVVVKGEKADPLKVLERVQKKTHRQVELLSPLPKPPAAEDNKKSEDKQPLKPEEKIQEPKVITVVLKVHMHCEACSMEIKKRIERMKEVEEATPDLKNSQVTVKGTFDPAKLVNYVFKKTGKHAIIVKQEPQEKKEDDKGKDGKEEKKGENGEEGKKGTEEKGDEGKADKEGGSAEGGSHQGNDAAGGSGGGDGAATVAAGEQGAKVVELKRNEFYYYPPRYAMEMYAYPPQIFSDENPNACSIM